MNMKYYIIALGSAALFALPSCVVPGDYYGAPRASVSSVSTSIRVLPTGYRTVRVGSSPYYYHGNSWYRPYNRGYIRCARPSNYYGSIGRPVGYSSSGISHLPYGYRSTHIGGSRYYSNGNSYYQNRGNKYYKTSRPSSSTQFNSSRSPQRNHQAASARQRSTNVSRPTNSGNRTPAANNQRPAQTLVTTNTPARTTSQNKEQAVVNKLKQLKSRY